MGKAKGEQRFNLKPTINRTRKANNLGQKATLREEPFYQITFNRSSND
ncbi:MAG: hypothetical protein F6K56_22820 [Moorea sp. SIO3G5]|nr:hypothetical protein [Moorena sp. SIO3G5]